MPSAKSKKIHSHVIQKNGIGSFKNIDPMKEGEPKESEEERRSMVRDWMERNAVAVIGQDGQVSRVMKTL